MGDPAFCRLVWIDRRRRCCPPAFLDPVSSVAGAGARGAQEASMELIEPEDRLAFEVLLQRHGLPASDFVLEDTDTTDPKGDENEGQRGVATVTRVSTQISRDYPIGFEPAWLERFRRDVEAGVFGG